MFLVLAVIGDRTFPSAMLIRGLITKASGRGCKSTTSLDINLRSIADFSGIPRETVRRKINQLVDLGWVTKQPDGSLLSNEQSQEDLEPLMLASIQYISGMLQMFTETLISTNVEAAQKATQDRRRELEQAGPMTWRKTCIARCHIYLADQVLILWTLVQALVGIASSAYRHSPDRHLALQTARYRRPRAWAADADQTFQPIGRAIMERRDLMKAVGAAAGSIAAATAVAGVSAPSASAAAVEGNALVNITPPDPEAFIAGTVHGQDIHRDRLCPRHGRGGRDASCAGGCQCRRCRLAEGTGRGNRRPDP